MAYSRLAPGLLADGGGHLLSPIGEETEAQLI